MLEPAGRSGTANMTIDADLLAETARTGRAFLRLYRFDPPCLSLGRNEPAAARYDRAAITRSEDHTSELQSHSDLVCRLLLEKKKNTNRNTQIYQHLSEMALTHYHRHL